MSKRVRRGFQPNDSDEDNDEHRFSTSPKLGEEPQAKKIKQSSSDKVVVLILDSSPHYSFCLSNRNNRYSNLLTLKLQTTSFLVSEFSKKKYEHFLSSASNFVFTDWTIRAALIRITDTFCIPYRIGCNLKSNKFKKLPIDMKTNRTMILHMLSTMDTGRLLNHVCYDLQNDVQFLLKVIKILTTNEQLKEYTLPDMKLSTAIELVKMDNTSFKFIPTRLKKTIEFIPLIASLFETNFSTEISLMRELHTFIRSEILNDKELALTYIRLIFFDDKFSKQQELVLLNFTLIQKQIIQFDDLMKKIIERDGNFLEYARDELKDDKEIAMTVVKNNVENFKFVSERLKMDKDVILETIKNSVGKLPKCLVKFLPNEKDFIIKAIKYNANVVFHASNELQDDRELWMEVLQGRKSITANFRVPCKFERDRDVFKLLLECKILPEYHIFRNDRELMLEYLKQKPQEFKNLPYQFKSDREIAKTAISQQGVLLEYAASELKDDREIVECAVLNNGKSLAFASYDLRNDRAIVMIAVKQNGLNLEYASEEMRNEREIVLSAVQQNSLALVFSSNTIKNDKQIVLEAISNNLDMIEYIGPDLINDRDIALIGVKNKHYLSLVCNELKNDKEIVLKSVENYPMSIIYASERLHYDYEIIYQAFNTFYNKKDKTEDKERIFDTLVSLTPTEFKRDAQFMLKLIKDCDSGLLCLASDELKANEDFILEVVSCSKITEIPTNLLLRKPFIIKLLAIDLHKYFCHLPEEVIYNEELMLEIIELFPDSFEELPKKFRKDVEFILRISNLQTVVKYLSQSVLSDNRVGIKILKTCKIDCRKYGNINYRYSNDEEIRKILLEKSISYLSELEIIDNMLEFKADIVFTLENILHLAREYLTDEKLIGKIIELLKKPELTCPTLADIAQYIEPDDQLKLEIMMKNPHYFEINNREIAKQLISHYRLVHDGISNDLLLDKDFILELMELLEYEDIESLELIQYEWIEDKEFISKASMIDIYYMFESGWDLDIESERYALYNTLSNYLNKECKNRAQLIDYAVRFLILLAETVSDSDSDSEESPESQCKPKGYFKNNENSSSSDNENDIIT